MRKFIFCGLLALISITPAFALEWNQEKGEHFIIYYTGENKPAQDAMAIAETYYWRIASELGYPRHSDFWTWDKRVKIYIYPDKESFLNATGEPKWSSGVADYANRQISGYAWDKNFLSSLLPHEIAHLIFRDFVGFQGNLPLWLNEGIAEWAEENLRAELHKKAKELYEKDSLLSVKDIITIDIRVLDQLGQQIFFRTTKTKDEKETVIMLSSDTLINNYYIESGSLIGFLLEKFGANPFAEFCRQLRDGRPTQEALFASYPEHITSIDELEKEWRKFLQQT